MPLYVLTCADDFRLVVVGAQSLVSRAVPATQKAKQEIETLFYNSLVSCVTCQPHLAVVAVDALEPKSGVPARFSSQNDTPRFGYSLRRNRGDTTQRTLSLSLSFPASNDGREKM